MKRDILVQRWKWLVVGAGLWWGAGFNLFFYHIAGFCLWMATLHDRSRKGQGLEVPASARMLGIIALIYAASIGVHIESADTSRIIAAVYNLSFWVLGAWLVMFLASRFRSEMIPDVMDAFYYLSFFIAAMAALILVFWIKGVHDLTIPTPMAGISRFLGDTNLVKDSLWIKPLMWDWFASVSRPRFNVFSPYPTAAGGCIMIVLMMIATRAVYLKRTGDPLFWAVFGGCMAGFVMTLSRISIMGFVFALFVVFLMGKKNFPIWLMMFLMVLMVAYPWLENFSEWVMGLRSGSTSTRFSLYRYSLEQLHDADWILGMGIKPRENIFAIPVGSHSTYISMLFKTGVAGVSAVLVFQAVVWMRWFGLRDRVRKQRHILLFWRCLGLVIISMSVWMATEDIDAPQFLAFLYFSLIGCLEGLHKELAHAPA